MIPILKDYEKKLAGVDLGPWKIEFINDWNDEPEDGEMVIQIKTQSNISVVVLHSGQKQIYTPYDGDFEDWAIFEKAKEIIDKLIA